MKRYPPLPTEARTAAARRSDGRCIVCGDWATEHHHVFPKRLFPELYAEPENIVVMCHQCHERHENAFRRIKVVELPACAVNLCVDNGPRLVYLARTYDARPD